MPRHEGTRARALRTADVARASGYSLQQVRDLERKGVIPAANRTASGYRTYSDLHIAALRVYRALVAAIGPVAARERLPRLWSTTMADAAAEVSGIHASLAHERSDLDAALRALDAIGATGRGDEIAADADAMSITQLAEALGVRTSTLRFWEEERLVTPDRVTALRVRSYPVAAVDEARVVAALRGAGYGVPAVRVAMAALRQVGDAAEVRAILQHRRELLAGRSIALLRAGSDLADLIDRRPVPGGSQAS